MNTVKDISDLEQELDILQKAVTNKELLLSFNLHLAQTRTREGLQGVMRKELKKLVHFSHNHILIFSPDKKSHEDFVPGPFAGTGTLPETQRPGSHSQVVDFNEYTTPVFLDLDALSGAGKLPESLRPHYDMGVKEIVTAGLRNDTEVFGIISFYSDHKDNFTEQNIDLVQGVAIQIAIAVDNIIAYENVERKEKETQILLSFSDAADKVRDRNGLVQIIRDKLSVLLSFTDIALTIYKAETRTFQVFAHQVAEKMGAHPKFTKVIVPSIRLKTGFTKLRCTQTRLSLSTLQMPCVALISMPEHSLYLNRE
jgi:formate hydrogenlyase transcriptional activator